MNERTGPEPPRLETVDLPELTEPGDTGDIREDERYDDLGWSGADREVDLSGSRIDTLTLSNARLADVDLRRADLRVVTGPAGLAGSWITESQLAQAGSTPRGPAEDRRRTCLIAVTRQ